MKEIIKMPRMAAKAQIGTVAVWNKEEGDRVFKGEILLEVEVDKIAGEIEAPANGILSRIFYGEGETVPIGAQLAELDCD